jgi:hypothetical protein
MESSDRIKYLETEILNLKFIAEGLTYDHQQSLRNDISRMIDGMEDELKDLRN